MDLPLWAIPILWYVGKYYGPLTKLYFEKRIEAGARARELRLLHETTEDLNNQKMLASVEGGQVSVTPQAGAPPVSVAELRQSPEAFVDIPEARTLDGALTSNLIQQRNIESVVGHALAEASEDPDFPQDMPDSNENWMNRFFNEARLISEAEVQALWGKVLAGEVKRPGSFSLRTLDVIRNLSKEEADIFTKLASGRIKVFRGGIWSLQPL